MSHRTSALILTLAAGLTALLAGMAGAAAPMDQPTAGELIQPQSPDAIYQALSRGQAGLPPEILSRRELDLLRFSREQGGRWSVQSWNPVTLTPRLVAGSGLDMGRTVPDAPSAESVALDFARLSSSLHGLDASRLDHVRTVHGLNKWSVHFIQKVDGLPVLGSRFTVAVTEAGRVAAFGGDLWPGIAGVQPPALAEAEAAEMVLYDLASRGMAPPVLGPEDFIRAEILGILPLGADQGRAVYRFRTFCMEPLGAWTVDLDARTGEVLQIRNALHTADISGTVTGDIENPGWCFGSDVFPVALMTVEVPGVGSDTTDANGGFLIPFGGSEPESVRIQFAGPYFEVNNTNGDDALFHDEILPGTPLDLFWDDANSRVDERDVFFHLNLAHQFIKGIEPGWTDLDFPLPANVNLQQSCNAFWNGSSVNFFHEANNCANTGRLGDVIHHEYGHGITDYMYGPGDPPSDMHEANSDVIGNYLTDESKMGRGFYLDDCENGIRDSNNDMVWPDDLNGSGHHDGQILAGFHWHLRENLILSLGPEAGHARAAQIWHLGRSMGLPQMQPEQVWWSFIADDDDGNLDSGTPNYDDICQAALRHGFECPEAFDHVVIHHLPLSYVESQNGDPIRVGAEIYSLDSAIDPDGVFIYYRKLGETDFQPALMVLEAGDDWAGELPGYPTGTFLEYYVFASDVDLNSLTDPREAPAVLHQTSVATVFDPFEEEGAWTAGAAGDDATQGIWEWCDPVGTMVGSYVIQPEDDATPDPGHLCWVTGQHTGGYPWTTDADGTTTLLSPIYDLTGNDWGILRYSRWFKTFSGAQGILNVDMYADGEWINLDHVSGWDAESGWTQVERNLTSYAPVLGQVQFRVVMYGEPNPSIDEAALDDFVIIAGEGASDAPSESEPAAGLRLALRSGNPANGSTSLSFALPEAGPAWLGVIDLSGRLVRTLAEGRMSAGLHEAHWDGRDENGRSVASGVYFLRLSAAQGMRHQRVIVVR